MQYYSLSPKVGSAGVRYSDSFATKHFKDHCRECRFVKFDIGSVEYLELQRNPENVLTNWTCYPDISSDFPIVKSEFVDALRTLQALSAVTIKPLRLENGDIVEGFVACIPNTVIRKRGGKDAKHALCPKCGKFWYNNNDGRDVLSMEVVDSPLIVRESTWLLIVEEKLMSRFTPAQRKRLLFEPLRLVQKPRDSLPAKLEDYPNQAWKELYLRCGGAPSTEKFRYSSEMNCQME